jgi:hypothetical protein
MLKLIFLLACASACFAETPATQPSSPARLAFDRFKALEGHWQGKSTKGWEDTGEYKTIAAGSAVMHTSFNAHPNQTMLTVFYMDGEDLMLVHYCVAKNQPRMKATEISPDGRSITFTFVDGGNLASRDKGHMDKAVYVFNEAADTFTTKWTWFQNGQERWMEEVLCSRKE